MKDIVFCDNCGKPCDPKYVKGFALIIKKIGDEEHYFCKDKCLKSYERKMAQMNKVKTGKRANYGATGI